MRRPARQAPAEPLAHGKGTGQQLRMRAERAVPEPVDRSAVRERLSPHLRREVERRTPIARVRRMPHPISPPRGERELLHPTQAPPSAPSGASRTARVPAAPAGAQPRVKSGRFPHRPAGR